MATNILMPALSPTMTEGTLTKWLKAEGDSIRAGDVIAEIETDKATMEVEAVDEGVLGKILVADGTEGVKVNAPIAVLVEAGESAPTTAAPAAPAKPAAPAEIVPQAAMQTPSSPPPAPMTNGHAPHGEPAGGERIFVSPLARRMAKQAGIDLSGIKGTGPGGRIVKADIEATQARPAAQAPASAVASAPPTAPAPKVASPALPIAAPHRLIPNSSMRKVIARRLAESKQTVPHFYVTMDIEIDALLKLRAELNAKSPKDGPGAFRLSVNDMVIKAAAITLRRIPMVNVCWTDDNIVAFDDIDISVAVSIPDGLITPIVRRADQKGLAAISNEMKDLAARAKTGKLKPDEFQGGGFSISNMGMYGVTSFSAIINPPQGAILAVAAGQQRPVVRNGELAVATVMSCTLSVDHRAVDGALGAEWIAAFKSVIEDPLSLML